MSDVGLLIGVGVVPGVEHGEVDGAALLRIHPLVGGHGRRRRVLQRLPAWPGWQAAAVLSVDEPMLNLINIIETVHLNTCGYFCVSIPHLLLLQPLHVLVVLVLPAASAVG